MADITTGHMVNSIYVGLALQVVGAGRGGSGSRRGGNCALNEDVDEGYLLIVEKTLVMVIVAKMEVIDKELVRRDLHFL